MSAPEPIQAKTKSPPRVDISGVLFYLSVTIRDIALRLRRHTVRSDLPSDCAVAVIDLPRRYISSITRRSASFVRERIISASALSHAR